MFHDKSQSQDDHSLLKTSPQVSPLLPACLCPGKNLCWRGTAAVLKLHYTALFCTDLQCTPPYCTTLHSQTWIHCTAPKNMTASHLPLAMQKQWHVRCLSCSSCRATLHSSTLNEVEAGAEVFCRSHFHRAPHSPTTFGSKRGHDYYAVLVCQNFVRTWFLGC